MNLISINEMIGFIYNGELYLDLCSSMSILGFEKFNENDNKKLILEAPPD